MRGGAERAEADLPPSKQALSGVCRKSVTHLVACPGEILSEAPRLSDLTRENRNLGVNR